MASGLPKLPSSAELGLSSVPRATDGKKTVPYKATRPQNTRAFQTPSPVPVTRFKPAAAVSTPTQTVKTKPYPQFIITPHVEIIADYIQKYPILAVDARTGTGKTRAIPHHMTTKGFKVRVAIPTTVAVRDAYNFQRDNSNLRVGYAAGREIHYNDTDQLVYATTGHFRQRIIGLIKDGKVSQVRDVLGDIIFIDEVHTGTTDITVLIALLRDLFVYQGVYRGPKIVFASATFNHGDIMDHFPDFPVYRVQDVTKPIQDIYLDNPRDPVRDDPNPEIIRIVKAEYERWLAGEKVHGLIFRPGANEVEETIEALDAAFPKDAKVRFTPAYSGLTPQEIDMIFQLSPDIMEVVVGTNLVESSVTIPDVGWEIDDMLVKIAETSSTGGEKLTLSLVSKAGSQQRRGRTGRTVPGRAYRLVTQKQFDELQPYTMREIDRIPIYDIVLQLIDADLDPIRVLRISPSRYEEARRVLINFGMISNENGRVTVTEVGRFVSSISMGIQNAFMVYLGFQRYLGKFHQSTEIDSDKMSLRTIIAVASMIEAYGPSFMYVPRKLRDESPVEYQARRDAHIEKYHEKFRGETDIHTFVNIFWHLMTETDVARQHDRSTGRKFTHYVKEWAVNNSMNNKKIKEFMTVFRDVEAMITSKLRDQNLREASPPSGYTEFLPRGLLGQDGYSMGRNLPDGGFSYLGNDIAPIFARAYIANHFHKDDRGGRVSYIDRKTGLNYQLDRGSSFNSLSMDKRNAPLEIVAARTVEVVGKTGRYYSAGIIVSQEYIPRAIGVTPTLPVSRRWEAVPVSQQPAPKLTAVPVSSQPAPKLTAVPVSSHPTPLPQLTFVPTTTSMQRTTTSLFPAIMAMPMATPTSSSAMTPAQQGLLGSTPATMSSPAPLFSIGPSGLPQLNIRK